MSLSVGSLFAGIGGLDLGLATRRYAGQMASGDRRLLQ